MTHPFGELSAQRKALGAALRRLRREAGLSGEQIAGRLGLSQSQVSRAELGQQSIPAAVAEQWARAAGGPDDAVAEVVELAEAAATQTVAWRRALAGGLVQLQRDSAEAEASAATILTFQNALIPGLLQTAEYAAVVFAAGYPHPAREAVAAAVAARLDRQAILFTGTKRIEFVLDEAVLHRQAGSPAAMRAQLDRLHAVTGSVTVGIIPFTTGLTACHEHEFTILADRGDGKDSLIHHETLSAPVNITGPEDVAFYQDAYAQLRDVAVFGEDAQRLITAAARAL